jgi:hypothetical protein
MIPLVIDVANVVEAKPPLEFLRPLSIGGIDKIRETGYLQPT